MAETRLSDGRGPEPTCQRSPAAQAGPHPHTWRGMGCFRSTGRRRALGGGTRPEASEPARCPSRFPTGNSPRRRGLRSQPMQDPHRYATPCAWDQYDTWWLSRRVPAAVPGSSRPGPGAAAGLSRAVVTHVTHCSQGPRRPLSSSVTRSNRGRRSCGRWVRGPA